MARGGGGGVGESMGDQVEGERTRELRWLDDRGVEQGGMIYRQGGGRVEGGGGVPCVTGRDRSPV